MGMFFLLILSLEVFSQIVGIRPIHPNCRSTDKTYYYKLKANSTCQSKTTQWNVTYNINSQNIREYEYPLSKAKDTYRILILGDSFVEGYGLQKAKTFPKLLESYLREGISKKTDVIAAGVSAWGTISEYFYLLNQGLSFEPNLVILAFHVNDFSDNFQAFNNLTPEGKSLLNLPPPLNQEFISQNDSLFSLPPNNQQPDTSTLTNIKIFIDNNSAIYNTTQLYLKNLFHKQVDFVPGDPTSDPFAITRVPRAANYESLLTQTQDVIKKMHTTLNSKKIDFIIVLIPSGHTINESEWNKGRVVWGFEKNKVYPNPVYEQMIVWGEKQVIKTLNPTNDIKTASLSQKLYYSYDGHFNQQGNKVVAQILFKLLSPKLK